MMSAVVIAVAVVIAATVIWSYIGYVGYKKGVKFQLFDGMMSAALLLLQSYRHILDVDYK